MRSRFNAVEVTSSDPYLNYFIDFYHAEIKAYFPLFDTALFKTEPENQTFALLLLRNATVAGVLMGVKQGQKLTVHLDFVTAVSRLITR